MKEVIYIILLIVVIGSCDSPEAPDCLKSTGETTVQTIDAAPFTSLEVNSAFKVVLKEAQKQAVSLQIGENLIDGVTYEVSEGKFIIQNDNSCQWTRPYELPVLTIEHPNITSIRQGGSGVITSDGILNYPNLSLVSEKQSGDFELSLNCQQLSVVSNDITNYFISGDVVKLGVMFASGDGRFEGRNLHTETAYIFQRGTNDIIVNVSTKLEGKILATGNIIMVGSKPDSIDVSVENLGRLIDKTE